MMFENTTPIPPAEMVRKLIEKVKAGIHNKRMRERQAILDRYTGKAVAEPIARYFDKSTTLKIVAIAEHNLIRRVVNREAMVYKDPPSVTYENDENIPDEYDQTERWMGFKKAERRTRCIGTGLIHPVWRDGRMQWDYLHNYEILTVGDPLIPNAVIYPVNMHVASSQIQESKWVYWDAERHFIIDTKGKRTVPAEDNKEMINPYGVLPFVSVHPDDQDDEYWVESPQLDVVNVMDALNKGVTEGRLAIRYAPGQRVISGHQGGKEKKLKTGLEYILDLSEGATYTHEATDADFAGMIEMLKFDIQTAFENHGMGAEFTESTGQASGYALMVRNLPLLELREDSAARWRRFDMQTYDIEQVIFEVEGKKKLPGERSLDYAEVTFPPTPEEQIARDDWDIQHGLITPAQILRRRDPDGYESDEEAQKIIDENLQVNRAQSGRSAFTRAAT